MLDGLLVDLVPFDKTYYDETMYAQWNDASRWWAMIGDYGPVSRAQVRAIQGHRAAGRERGYTGVHFMIRAKDGKRIGSTGLNWVDNTNRSAMFGIWIAEADYRAGGHGTDAITLLTDYAFNWLDVRRVWMITMAINDGMKAVGERLGYKLEACGRDMTYANGQWVDLLTYGIMQDEWLGREVLVEKLGLRAKAEQRYGAD